MVQSRLTVRQLGLVPYRDGIALQEEHVRARAAGEIADTLLLLEHPPVLTAGRGTADGSVIADAATLERLGLEVVPVSRGGDVTWHGPGQLVGYPICDLGAQGHDLHRFLRGIEQGLIDSLKRFGITSHRIEGRTGVWVVAPEGRARESLKIASIGIAVRRWVSYHGFALNVAPDLGDFELIHPCGYPDVRMTSMQRMLGDGCPSWARVQAVVADEMGHALGYDGVRNESEGVAA